MAAARLRQGDTSADSGGLLLALFREAVKVALACLCPRTQMAAIARRVRSSCLWLLRACGKGTRQLTQVSRSKGHE